MAQVVERLLCNHEALSSYSIPTKKKFVVNKIENCKKMQLSINPLREFHYTFSYVAFQAFS
jgi:hypothetical protein